MQRSESEEAGGFRESSQVLSRLNPNPNPNADPNQALSRLTNPNPNPNPYPNPNQALSRLSGVLLNGCRTERIGRRIIVALGAVLPHVAVQP